MRICFYSPYIPQHTGGGEKYLFDCMRAVADQGEVSLAIASNGLNEQDLTQVKNKYEAFLGSTLDQIKITASPLGTNASFLTKLNWTKQWDVLYYLSDGSLFFSLAKKNILHLQFPFTEPKSSLIDRIKLINWSIKNTNSEFTKKNIEEHWRTKIDIVHQPGIETDLFSPTEQQLLKKEKVILHVGRFFRQLHSKRQDVLVRLFKELKEKFPTQSQNWQLVLIGTVEDQAYYEEVKQASQGLSVQILTSVSRQELINWYKRSAVYWHATGYDIDENSEPTKVEHFGISTVEAMAAGCVPVVINKGGQKEILGSAFQELLWNSDSECLETTAKYLTNTSLDFRKQIMTRAKVFSYEIFKKKMIEMIRL